MRPMLKPLALALALALPGYALAESLTVLHVGDQESWLISAQGNLRDNAGQATGPVLSRSNSWLPKVVASKPIWRAAMAS